MAATLDRSGRLLVAASFLRALATGMLGVLLGIYLAKVGLPPREIGFVLSAGLIGCAFATLVATAYGDRIGRRRLLFTFGIISAAFAGLAAVSSGAVPLALAAFLGMLNGMGRDRGAALVLEQAILPSTTETSNRTRAFAYYNVAQDLGHAVGGLAAGLPLLLRSVSGAGEETSFRIAIGAYAGLLLAALPLYARLPRSVEAHTVSPPFQMSPGTRRVVLRLSMLFSVDAIGGGFLLTSLLAYFFYERFHVSEFTVGLLFVAARMANAFSHLGAAWLAKRIGLVNTMVFTHIPASLLLLTVTFAPSFPIAALLFILREGLVEMDVPTRQSYVMAMVGESERTAASGITGLVRMGGWAVAPLFAGAMIGTAAMALPLWIGAGMKISYDLLLWRSFRKLKPPEER